MKNSKKTHQILKKLDKLQEYMYYFMLDGPAYAEVSQDIKELRSHIEELSLERKEHNARFARKLKGIWDSQHE